MPASTSSPGSGERASTRWLPALFAGVLAGPLAWLVALEAAYIASYAACAPGRGAVLHVSVLAPLAIVAAAALLVRAADRRRPEDERHGGAHLMSLAARWLLPAFALLIFATWVPVWALEPCR